MTSESLEKVYDLKPDSTEQELFDAIDGLTKVHIESKKYGFAWRKLSLLLRRQQHEQMANLTKWLTWGTWVLAMATWVPVVVAIIVPIIVQ